MPMIPLRTESVIAEGGQRRPSAGILGNQAGAGLINLGGTVADIGASALDGMARERARAYKEAQQTADRVASVTAKASVENDLSDLADKFKTSVLRGDYAKDAIDPTTGEPLQTAGKDPIGMYRQAAQGLVTAHTSGLSSDMASLVGAETLRHAGMQANSIADVVTHRQQQDVGVQLVVAGDEFGRMAMRDRSTAVMQYENIVDKIGPQAGWDPTKMAAEKARFREGAAYNSARMAVLGARDNIASLNLVGQQVQGPEFADLSPEKLAPILQTLEMRKQTLTAQQAAAEARAAAAQQRRLTEAGIAVDGFQKIVDAGGTADPAYALDVSQAVAGTPYAPILKAMVKTAGDRAGFASLSPQQQTAQLATMRAEANAKGTDPDNEKRIATLQSLHDKGMKQLDADPLVYGANRNLIPSITPLRLDSIDSLAPALAARRDSAKTVSAATGRAVSPLTADESSQLASMLAPMKPSQKAQALKFISSAVGDPTQVGALAAQLNDKDPATALALLAGKHQTDTGRPLAELILQGSDAHRNKRVDEAGMQPTMRSIAQKIEAVPWPTAAARDAATLAAQMIYRGQKDSVIPTSEDNAIKLATGGIVDWAGAKITLPYGMQTESEFKNAMRSMDAQKLAEQAGADHVVVRGQPVPMAVLADGLSSTKLLPAGDGIYVMQSGNAIVQLPNGRPFRLRVQ